jgi:uncharacterized protein (DUF2336 family)
MAERLSSSDIERMIENPSTQGREETAAKVAIGYKDGGLSQSERKIAEDIFRVMMKDAEERVRAALATQLQHASELSPDVASALAHDVSDLVALPMLAFSEALSDEVLIDIVQTQDVSRQVAVAERKVVSSTLSTALIDEGSEAAVASLVGNAGAEIGENAMHKVIDKFGTSKQVQGAMVKRATLPVAVSERLVSMVSDKLQEYLVTHHELSADLASDLVLESRERATLGLLGSDAAEHDVSELVAQLDQNGRLTPSIILRALCVGDLRFFEASVAQLAKVSLINARQLVHDQGNRGLDMIYARCGLPPSLLPAYRIALDVARENERDRTDETPDAIMKRTLERVLTHFEDSVDEHNRDDVNFLLARLERAANAA